MSACNRRLGLLLIGLIGLAGGWAAAAAPPGNDRPGTGGPLPPGWLGAVSEEIRRSEYRFSDAGAGAWSAPNRAHDLRTRISDAGIEVVSRTEGAAAWRLSLRLLAFGRDGTMRPAAPALPDADGNRASLRRDDLVEWYVNGEDGLEQGFTIEAPPEDRFSRDPLVLEMALDGSLDPRLTADRQTVVFSTRKGEEVLRYTGLHVSDADGVQVPARLEILSRRILIRIEDAGAVYPLTVDPLLTSPAWSVTGAPDAWLGLSVSTAGDVNGDGYSDLIAGAPKYDDGMADEGGAFVYLGSASGPSTSPDWTVDGDLGGAEFGRSVATAGDVNGDGYDDVIVGAPLHTNGQSEEGAAYLWLGSATGLDPNATTANADWSFEGNQQNARFGWSVATAGDVDGSGRSDVLIGAPRATSVQEREGMVYLFLGVPAGLASLPAWTAESNQACTNFPPCVGPEFGASVASAGDVNADGYSDILVGADQYENGGAFEGAAFVWFGGPSFGSGPNGTPANANWYAESDLDYSHFGQSVGGAGDVNGDGYGDVIIGAPAYYDAQPNEGMAFVWLGNAGGLGPVGSPANADWQAEGNQDSSNFGRSVGTAGDLNGDGFSDLVVGADQYTQTATFEGAAFVWLGGPGGLGSSGNPLNADWSAAGGQAFAQLGRSAATAGDVNGDGYSDVIVGAPLYDDGMASENGRALLYLGSQDGPAAAAAWNADGDQIDARFGMSVASAGDVNGDGYSDLIVGAPRYDNGAADEGQAFLFIGSSGGAFFMPSWTARSDQKNALFGSSVASAGDVNGDGHSDVVIGAPGYQKSLTDEGGAFLWFGGPADVSDPSGMGPDGTPLNSAWEVRGGQAGAQMGTSVAWAGDVNGDGFSDIIVGAPFHDNGQTDEGRAYIYPGSPAGPSGATWTVESGQDDAHLGSSVASAGDVNGDGFSDVIVGAPDTDAGHTDEGRAFVFLGSGGTLSTIVHWITESNQAGARLGASVASAGDVNGDGFSDVIVGAPGYTSSYAGEGIVSVWPGGPSGLSTGYMWLAYGDANSVALGASVASAGDLNQDGYGDVIIGAPGYGNGQTDEGLAAVWFGSQTGLGPYGAPANAAWRIESDQVSALLGSSVAPAGDVNGDGFPDLIVGAPYYNFPDPDEGRAFLYYGNGGDGLHRIPRQARADDTALVHLLGKSESEVSFRLWALGRTPAGRGNVRLQWEVKPLGTPFDGSGLGTSAAGVDTGPPDFFDGSAVELNELVSGLSAGTFYHWRVRLLSDTPFFPRSPWFSSPHNTQTESDILTTGCIDRDGDGYGAAPDPLCAGGSTLDCDDGEPSVFPGNPEICDGLDNNCDGSIDEGDPGGGSFCWTGLPGVCSDGTTACEGGTIVCEQDVPRSDEICDRLDNDCDGVLPSDEIDSDGDGFTPCEGDCDDTDFGSIAVPQAVTGLVVSELTPGPGYLFTWDSQDLTAGRGTVYDIFSGPVSDLPPWGDFSTGSCLAEDIAGAEEYELTGPDPPPGEAFYYMLRGQNGCPGGTGTYGNDNRDEKAALSSSPCS